MERFTIINAESVETVVSQEEYNEALTSKEYFNYHTDSQVIPVYKNSEKNRLIYEAIMRPIWREKKQIERNTRCLDDKGNICKGVCTGCPKADERPNRNHSSWEVAVEAGFQKADNEVSVEDTVESKIRNDTLRRRLAKIDPELVDIANTFFEGKSIKDYADKLSAVTPEVTYEALYQRAHRKFTRFKDEAKKFYQEWGAERK